MRCLRVYVNSSLFCYIDAMTLSEKIQKDLVGAMRSKDEIRLSVLRSIKSAIQYKETEKIRALGNFPGRNFNSHNTGRTSALRQKTTLEESHSRSLHD